MCVCVCVRVCRDHLIKARAAGLCVRSIECGFVPVAHVCLKLVKLQAKYLGPVWRRSHMHLVSAVYRLIGVQVCVPLAARVWVSARVCLCPL